MQEAVVWLLTSPAKIETADNAKKGIAMRLCLLNFCFINCPSVKLLKRMKHHFGFRFRPKTNNV